MIALRRWTGAGWVSATCRQWDGAAWKVLTGSGSVVTPAPTGFTVTQALDTPLSTDAPTVTHLSPISTELTEADWTRIPYTEIATPGLHATPTSTITVPGSYGKQTIQTIGPLDMPYAAEWDMDADAAGLVLIKTGSGTGGEPEYRIFVDGNPVTAEVQTLTEAATTGNRYVVKMEWATTAQRRVRVEVVNAGLVGVDVPPGTTITAPTPTAPTLAIAGDSYVEGTLEAGDFRLDALAWLIGRVLAAPTYVAGYGGTGYVAGATQTPPRHYLSENRVAPIIAAAPDVLVVFGTINDNGTSSATIQSNATALYNRVATDLPSTKVIVVGPESYNDASNTSTINLANRNAVKAAALDAPNVVGFVDPMAEQWITGTGNSTSPTGDGNADIYHNGGNLNHLTKAGNRYYAEKVASAIASLIPA